METSSTEHVLSEHAEAPSPFLVHIAPSMMEQAWEHIEPLLSKACAESRGEFSIPLILANLEHWPILAIVRGDRVQAVMVTCVSIQPHRRVLDCILASGDHAKDWPLVDEDFDAFARGFGCSAVRIPHARKGWQRTLPHWDWTGIVLERKI